MRQLSIVLRVATLVAAETMEEEGMMPNESLPLRLGVSARNVQLMKASFFADDLGEADQGIYTWSVHFFCRCTLCFPFPCNSAEFSFCLAY
jgi:hypothetical protein